MPNDAETLERARLLYQSGRYELAADEMRRHLAWEPDDARAHSMLALCLIEIEQDPVDAKSQGMQGMSEAMRHARDGVLLAPERGFTHHVYASVLLSEGQKERAEVAIRAAIDLEPEDADHYGFIASLLINSDRLEEGLQLAEAGLSFEPNDIRCANSRSTMLFQQDRWKEALAATEYTLNIDPENAFAHTLKGWVHIRNGESGQAIDAFRSALRTDPALTWALEGQVQALKANTFYYRLVNFIPAWMLPVIVAAGWVGAHLIPRMGKALPAQVPLIIAVLVIYFLLNLLFCASTSVLNILVPLTRYLPKDAEGKKRAPWTLLEIAYLISLAFLPFSVRFWFPGLLASLLADTLLILVLVWEMGDREWTLTHGKIAATAFLLIVDAWLRG